MKKTEYEMLPPSAGMRQGDAPVIIYGAGLMGRSLLRVLKEPPYDYEVLCFIVKSKEGNPEYVEGIRVISIDEAEEYKHRPVFVALHEKHAADAVNDLTEAGFSRLIPVTFDSDLWCGIRERWMQENKIEPYGVSSFLSDSGSPRLHIYVVHSGSDQKLSEKIRDHEYEIPIRAGAGGTEGIHCGVSDNTGDNISDKNRQYCELTGLYWAWKNDRADFIGLSHYRRRFVLDDSDVRNILSGAADMVVTVPVMNLDTVKGQYIKDHDESDWDIMTEAVAELSPGYMQALKTVGDGNFYFAYNMFIAKRKILDDYCSWLFPILEYCEDRIGRKDDAYQNRYPGFLAERLLTVYIAGHSELHVVAVKKHFIEAEAD